jgi:hypothetical protein
MCHVDTKYECRFPCTWVGLREEHSKTEGINILARSSHAFTMRLFTVSVLITCARLVGLKSPVRELTVTSFKSIFARTDVKRTSESLYHVLSTFLEKEQIAHHCSLIISKKSR